MSILTINDPISEEFLISKGFEKHYNTEIQILNVESVRYYTKTIKIRVGKEDHRSDEITKKEIYENHIAPWYDVVCVFDDRNRVVKMWRDLGLLVAQVYDGDF